MISRVTVCLDARAADSTTPTIESGLRRPLMQNASRLRFCLTSFLLGMIFVHAVLFWVVRQQLIAGSSDFRIFYTAGLMLRRGEGRLLYDEALQTEVERESAPQAVKRGGPLPYNHPPFEATLFVPLTYLPYFSAYCVWIGLNMLLLAGSIYLIRPRLPALKEHYPWLLALAPLAFFPIAYALLQGQDSILLLALYCIAYAAFRRGNDVEAGAYLGMGLFKFHLILPFAFILLLRRRWRALAGMSVIAAVELVVSWTLVGARQLLLYPTFAWHVNREQAPGVIVPANMANLRGLLEGWKGMSYPPPWIDIAIMAVSIGLLIWSSRRWQSVGLTDKIQWDSAFSISLVVTYLVGYHGYNHDMSFLLLPLVLTIDRVLEVPGKASAGLKLVLVLMFFTPLYLLLTLQWSHQNLFSIVLLCFAGYLAASAKAPPPASADKDTVPSSVPLL